MLSKRDLVASAAARGGLLSCIRGVRQYYLKDLRVLAYHRVLPRSDAVAFPFDPELISAWSEDFDWQMKYVASRFDVLNCSQVVESLESGGKLPRRPLVVTFDDGFADNFEYAFPILRSRRLPAVVFLSTGYVGGTDIFWFDLLTFLVTQTERTYIPLTVAGIELAIPQNPECRREVVLTLLRHLKKVSNEERESALVRLRDFLGVSVPDGLRHKSAVLNWDQVREMASGGIEFGSHTVTHPVLSRVLDDSLLDRELVESRCEIQRQTSRQVVSIAYPVGGKSAVDERVIVAVERAGYKIAFTYQTGLNRIGSWDRFQLKRLRVERYMRRDMFRAMVEAPELFAVGG
jgi:peptidoglycan/xylan/chitin deacetylase (PgdA/CDA1 family)